MMPKKSITNVLKKAPQSRLYTAGGYSRNACSFANVPAVRAFGFARTSKRATDLGKWKTEKMPASAFELSHGHGHALGRTWTWRVCELEDEAVRKSAEVKTNQIDCSYADVDDEAYSLDLEKNNAPRAAAVKP
jgi:hypothetical protein